ncbi:MAG TPA: hypothetical protein EYN69_04955 [Flavobacteriales bacterium]|nr:hypothetical protein [Flavobacteriales bacterium]
MSPLSFQEFRIKTLVNLPDPDAVINEMALLMLDEEPVIDELKVIIKKKRDDKVQLPGDKSKVKVDVASATAVVNVFKNLHSRNQTKMLQMLQKKSGFERMVKFSLKQTSF